mmetsp:Transcript_12686/g.53363  ORF Transcript_12686/g.53363 Transcript_12686/m.53363 type:complete len:275 (-) Transcript_12686:127-951(-)
MASSRGTCAVRAAAMPPMKASPAPTVSSTSTLSVCRTAVAPSSLNTTAPCSPSVRHTVTDVAMYRQRPASIAREAVASDVQPSAVTTPRDCALSCTRSSSTTMPMKRSICSTSTSFTASMSRWRYTSLGTRAVGALLRSTKAPAACAAAATAQFSSGDTSDCSSTAHGRVGSFRASASAALVPSKSDARRHMLAPAATMIWFSPVAVEHATIASAVGTPSSDSRAATRTPRRRRLPSATSANWSLPTHATISTAAPAQVAAHAWFAPFPPPART